MALCCPAETSPPGSVLFFCSHLMVKHKSHQWICSRIMSVVLSFQQMFLHWGQRSWQRPHKPGQSRSYEWEKQVIAGHVTVGQDTRYHCSFPLFFLSFRWKKDWSARSRKRHGTVCVVRVNEMLPPSQKPICCNIAAFISKWNDGWAQPVLVALSQNSRYI